MEKAKETKPSPSAGDHIYVTRSICYAHHGICVGKDKIIHYQTPMESGYPDPQSCRVIESDMRTFLGDDTNWFVFRYGVKDDQAQQYPKGTFTTKECDDSKLVIKRARQALRDGFSHYNIVGNNCEDFANFCKTGQRSMESTQFSEALERVAVARRAMSSGYRSPLVYAGCVMGLFTLNDFKNQPVNHIPVNETSSNDTSDIDSSTDEEMKREKDSSEWKGNETEITTQLDSKANIKKNETQTKSIIVTKSEWNTAKNPTPAGKKVNFNVPV